MASRSKSTPQWLNSLGGNQDLDDIINQINTTLSFYVCYIDTTASGGSPETFQWSGSPGNFSYTIPQSKHGKGKGANYSNYFPRVKTYSFVSGNQWEETYDSPAIDISTGNVTVYSNANTPRYLVIIW